MPNENDPLPIKQPAKAKRLNRTYKKRLTKKQIKIRKRKALTILAALIIGSSIISGYGEATGRYLTSLNEQNGSLTYRAAQAAPTVNLELIDVSTGIIREVTAYNSVPEQTDASPCIAADGSDVCKRYAAGECIAAANFLPLGSKIYVDKIGECTVADRMNSRYQNRVDIFMDKDIARAVKFGRQNLLVKNLD